MPKSSTVHVAEQLGDTKEVSSPQSKKPPRPSHQGPPSEGRALKKRMRRAALTPGLRSWLDNVIVPRLVQEYQAEKA